MNTLRSLATLALSLLVGCADGASAPTLPSDDPTILLSAPVPQSLLDGGDSAATVVFVSARLGSFPRGARATVGRRGTHPAVDVPIGGGGFDAVSLRADAGDDIEVVVTDSSGARRVETGTARAPARPKVVRTSPGSRRSDVPLNIVMQVAFSAPMNAASVSAALELYRGETRVPGTVALRDDNGTMASFLPDAPLEPSTEYRLMLASSAHDVLGGMLDSAVVVTFTTTEAANLPVAQVVRIEGWLGTLLPGASIQLRAFACVQYFVPCDEVTVPISWSSSAPGVASVTAAGLVTTMSEGFAIIIASSGIGADSLRTMVSSATAPTSLSSNQIVFAASGNLWAIRADGSGLTRLTTGDLFQGEPSVAADGRIVFVEGGIESDRRLRIREMDGSLRTLPLLSARTRTQCPTWSPDMRYIAYLESVPGYYRSGILRVVYAESTMVEVVASLASAATCPSWSPDGTRISFGVVEGTSGPPPDARGTIWTTRMRVHTLATAFDVEPLPDPLVPGRWSPAGDAVVSGKAGGPAEYWEYWVVRAPLDGTSGRRLWLVEYPPSDDDLGVPQWSPDGTLITFADGAGSFWLIDAANDGGRWWGTWVADGANPTFVPPGVSFTR